MAANQYGIDLGGVYRDVEAIKGARTQNKLSALKLGEAERLEAERPAKEQANKERQNMLADLRSKSAGGDANAQKTLLSLDPENGPKFIEAVSKMDETQREATKRTVEEVGQLSSYVLQGKTEEERARRYALARSGVSQEVQAKMPETFSAQFVELSLAKATSMDKLLENPKSIQVGGEDVVYKGGQEIERANVPVKASSESSSDSGVKSADESLMYRQSAELLGGLFDQQGNITNLDPEVRNKVQGIATEATNIFKQGGVTRSQAVKMAAQKYGLNVNDPGTATNNDPLGLR